jgi:hypothetical protein
MREVSVLLEDVWDAGKCGFLPGFAGRVDVVMRRT